MSLESPANFKGDVFRTRGGGISDLPSFYTFLLRRHNALYETFNYLLLQEIFILVLTVYGKRQNEFVAIIKVCCDETDATYLTSRIVQQLVFKGTMLGSEPASKQVSQLGMD